MSFLSVLGKLANPISAIGGLISGVSGAASAAANNKTQLEIARMNNDFNREMANQQMQYNSAMYERQLQDYSPTAIRDRLDDAGLNSALIMSGGSGVASSAGSSPTVGLPQAHNTFNGQNVGEGIALGIDGFAKLLSTLSQSDNLQSNTRLNNANARATEIQNAYAQQQILANLAYMAANTKDVDARRTFQEMQNQVQRQTLNDQIARYKIENNNLELYGQVQAAQKAYIDTQNSIGQKQLAWMDKEKQMQLALIASQTHLSDAQAAESCKRQILISAQSQGVQISNRLAQQTAWDYVKTARANRSFAEWNAVTQRWKSKEAQNNSGPHSWRDSWNLGNHAPWETPAVDAIDLLKPF